MCGTIAAGVDGERAAHALGGVGAAAGAAIGHTLGYREGSLDIGAVPARSEPGFDHVVVIMGENRSFDNLLGWLYTPENGA